MEICIFGRNPGKPGYERAATGFFSFGLGLIHEMDFMIWVVLTLKNQM